MEKSLKYAIRLDVFYDNGGSLGSILSSLEEAKLHDSLKEATKRLKKLLHPDNPIKYGHGVITPIEVYEGRRTVELTDLLEATGFVVSIITGLDTSYYVGVRGWEIPINGPIDEAYVYEDLADAQYRAKVLQAWGYDYASIHPVKVTEGRTTRLDLEAA